MRSLHNLLLVIALLLSSCTHSPNPARPERSRRVKKSSLQFLTPDSRLPAGALAKAGPLTPEFAADLFPALPIPSNTLEWLETAREETFQRVADRIRHANSLLSSYGMDVLTVTGSYFKVELETHLEFGETTTVRVRPRIKADLSCPKLKDRWRLFVESAPSLELPHRDLIDAETEVFSSLRRLIHDSGLSRIDIGVGIKWEWPPVPYVELDLKRLFHTDSWHIHPDQSFFWTEEDGFGSKTSLRLDWWATDHILLRSDSSVRLTQESPIWEWEQTLHLAYILDRQRKTPRYAIGLETTAIGHYEDREGTAELYRASLLYRRPICQDWLNIRFAGGAEWRMDEEEQCVPFVRVGMDALFGKSRP